ncbi:hypothetical protein MCP1_10058 [Candidatus Terasakiella magnetica]|nr:hypothetical protein MCP1_10058 [Candidatus Terasakiella magnetica]
MGRYVMNPPPSGWSVAIFPLSIVYILALKALIKATKQIYKYILN